MICRSAVKAELILSGADLGLVDGSERGHAMTDLTEILAAHAADFPADGIAPDLAASLSRNLTDGLAAIVGGSTAPGVDELAAQVGEAKVV